MRTTTTAAVLLATLALAGCSSAPTQDEIAAACVTALGARPDGDKTKPKACEGISEDDYTALAVAQATKDLGWTDEDGNFDKNKMLKDVIEGEDQP